MKKLLIFLGFFGLLLAASPARSQCFSYGCNNNPYYYYDLASYTYFLQNAPSYLKIAVGIDAGFAAIQHGIYLADESKAMNQYMMARRNELENYKSVKRYYTEGIPPFATIAPNGKPRSPKITWSDVESIH